MTLPIPNDKEEQFLNYIASGQGELPIPQSRKQIYLDHIARYGSAGGDGSGHMHPNKIALDDITQTDVDNMKQIAEMYADVEGSFITVKDSKVATIKDIQILGNTVQDVNNLSNIKSCGIDKGDGAFEMSILSHGKNLFNHNIKPKFTLDANGIEVSAKEYAISDFIKVHDSCRNLYYSSNYNLEFLYFYDKNKSFLSRVVVNFNSKSISVPLGAMHVRMRFISNQGAVDFDTNLIQWIQLEEGTTATSYEPYKENKSSILLPVQLEKVGDIADRLYYDEVEKAWCVEDNTMDLNSLDYIKQASDIKYYGDKGTDYVGFFFYINGVKVSTDTKEKCISNRFKTANNSDSVSGGLGEFCYSSYEVSSDRSFVSFSIAKSKLTDLTPSAMFSYLKSNETIFKIPVIGTKKIVLPLDTQIQLNSFLGTTHIVLECGEVEGRVKAKVSKSLGASVESLHVKTNILNDRVEAIEGLKDSQVMNYESDKGYLVCQSTKDGVVDNLAIQGKTLVNLIETLKTMTYRGYAYDESSKVLKSPSNGSDQMTWDSIPPIMSIKQNCEYTLIVNVIDEGSRLQVRSNNIDNDIDNRNIPKGINIIKFVSNGTDFKLKFIDSNNAVQKSCSHLMILEGDLTQNPPSGYIEGLKNVGEDVDKIEVLSMNNSCNLLKPLSSGVATNLPNVDISGLKYSFSYTATDWGQGITLNVDNLIPSCKYTFCVDSSEKMVVQLVSGFNEKGDQPFVSNKVTVTAKDSKAKIMIKNATQTGNIVCNNIRLVFGDKYRETFDYQEPHKKQLLFYNSSGELTPVPMLAEFDRIEKHADGKWYWHRLGVKVVLNGSENVSIYSHGDINSEMIGFAVPKNVSDCKYYAYEESNVGFANNGTVNGLSCTRKKTSGVSYTVHSNGNVYAIIPRSLNVLTNEQFKAWLQANNVTVVYQLAKEEVYELAPLHLESYANETMIMCNAGAISPNIKFSIASYISDIIKAYGDRISLLEDKVYKYMVAQNRLQLASTYGTDAVTFKVDYAAMNAKSTDEYDNDLYMLILNNILVGKDNYNYDKMASMLLDYASWKQISWEQFDKLMALMDHQRNPIVENPAEEASKA